MKKLLFALGLALGISPAYAWGDREQGALIGFAAGLLSHQLQYDRHYLPRYQIYNYSYPNVYISPPPVYNGYVPLQPIYTHQIVFDPICQCYRQIVIQSGWQ